MESGHDPNPVLQTSIDAFAFCNAPNTPGHKLYCLRNRCNTFFEDATALRLHYGIVECIQRYQQFLLVVVRFKQQDQMLTAESNFFLEMRRGSASPQPTPHEQIALARQTVLGHLVALDIETCYLAAKHVLDRSADLVKFVFGIVLFNPKHKRELGSTFSHFEGSFDPIVQKLNLTADPNFKQKLAGLKSIVDYRNKRIEHVEDFGRGRGIKSGGAEGTRISFHHESTDTAEIETKNPTVISDAIGDYLVDFVAFLDANLHKSPLPKKST